MTLWMTALTLTGMISTIAVFHWMTTQAQLKRLKVRASLKRDRSRIHRQP